jgi:MFS family permease
LRFRRHLPPVLHRRDYTRLFVALLAMGLGSQIVVVAVGWQVYAIHHSAFDLGLIGLFEFAPLPILALPAGQLADRIPRRLQALLSLGMMVSVAAGLLVVTVNSASKTWPFFLLAGATGVASAIGWPAFGALTPELVPVEILPSAMALRSIAGQAAVVAGPALGGVLFSVHPESVYAVAAALFAVALAALLGLRGRPLVRSVERAPGFAGLADGVRFVLRTRMLLGAIALDLFAVLLGDAIALAPVFAITILHTGPVGLGLLRTSPSVGALAAGLILTRRPLRRPAGPTLLAVVGTFGAATIVFGLSKWLPLSMAALMLTGFADMISMNIRSTAVALLTPPQLQGRVAAVEWVFIGASNELGAFWSGALARLIGTVPSVVAGGAAMIGIAVSWTRLFPALARLGRLEDLRPEPA